MATGQRSTKRHLAAATRSADTGMPSTKVRSCRMFGNDERSCTGAPVVGSSGSAEQRLGGPLLGNLAAYMMTTRSHVSASADGS
jgi:hypothetical protein